MVTAWCRMRRSNSPERRGPWRRRARRAEEGRPPAADAAYARRAGRARGLVARRRREPGARRPRALAQLSADRLQHVVASGPAPSPRASSAPRPSKTSAGPPTSEASAVTGRPGRPRRARSARAARARPAPAGARRTLVDEMGEGLLGDRDERHLVGHLEDREAELRGSGAHRLGEPRHARSRCRSRAREVMRREPLQVRALCSGPASCMPVVSSSSPPDSHGVGSASSRCGPSGRAGPALLPRHEADVEVLDEVAEGKHVWPQRSASLRDAASSAGRNAASISPKSPGPAISGGESWITGSPRSSARQISPRRNRSRAEEVASSQSHSSGVRSPSSPGR